jgi:hypothetical protein
MGTEFRPLSSLHVCRQLQPRGGEIDREAVKDYAAAMRAGDRFPPLVAYEVTDRDFPAPALVAGFQRYEAYAAAGIPDAEVEIRTGTFAEAWLAGYQSNLTHGVRYTNPQKRAAAEQAALLFRDLSAPQLAERLAVSDEFVRRVRKDLIAAGKLEPADTVTASDGSSYPSKIKHRSEKSPTVGVSSDETESDAESVSQPDDAPGGEVDEETPGLFAANDQPDEPTDEDAPAAGADEDRPADSMLYVRPRQSVAEDVQKEIRRLRDFRLFVSGLWSNEHFRPAVEAAAERNGVRWEWDGDSENSTKLQTFTLAYKTCTCDQLTALAHFAADLHSLLLRPEASDAAPWEDQP